MVKYKNTTGWTVNMFGKYGEQFTMHPEEVKELPVNITVIPDGVIRVEQKIKPSRKKVKDKEPIIEEEENKESDE